VAGRRARLAGGGAAHRHRRNGDRVARGVAEFSSGADGNLQQIAAREF